jgi:Immunity protein 10
MIETFEAQCCAVTILEESNTLLIVFADTADHPSALLELQRSFEAFDQQDVELGMDTYCVITSSGATHYGGIISCTMSDTLLQLMLSEEASATLGVTGYAIRLAFSSSEKASLRSGLIRLFEHDKRAPHVFNI